MSQLLAGNVAIVTGASSGIGRAIAIAYAQEGASVILADLIDAPLEGGESTLALIQKSGGQAAFERVDVGQWEQIDRLVGAALAKFGRLDIMVNNAAISSATNLLETTEAQWDQVLRANLTGMFHGCKRAVQQMIGQESRALRSDTRRRKSHDSLTDNKHNQQPGTPIMKSRLLAFAFAVVFGVAPVGVVVAVAGFPDFEKDVRVEVVGNPAPARRIRQRRWDRRWTT